MAETMRSLESLEAVQAAVDAVVASGTFLMHPDAPECPTLPRPDPKLQNEPTALPATTAPTPRTSAARHAGGHSAAQSAGSLPRTAPPLPGMPPNAPTCPSGRPFCQNEPISAPDPLSPRQLSAIALLFAGRSCSALARALQIDRKTLYRWRRSPDFIDEVRRRRLALQAQSQPATRPPASKPAAKPPATLSRKEFERFIR